MKVCVVGNSHVAMLAAAARETPSSLDLTFYAKPGLKRGEADLEGTTLRALSPELTARLDSLGTDRDLDLAGFDAVVFVALFPSAFAVARMAQAHVVTGWPAAQTRLAAFADPSGDRPRRALLSRQALKAGLLAQAVNSDGITWARALMHRVPMPIFLIPQPLPSVAMLAGQAHFPVFRRIHRAGNGAALLEDLRAALAGASDPAMTWLHQPEDSIVKGCFTRQTYMRGAPRLAQTSDQKTDDVIHANAAMGHYYLDHISRCLGG